MTSSAEVHHSSLITHHLVRVATIFLLLVAAVEGVTWLALRRIDGDFFARSTIHVDREVTHVRRTIAKTEHELDLTAAEIDAATRGQTSRGALFHALRRFVNAPGRGARILRNGDVTAWWGEDLRVSGTDSYQFDTTDLYVIRTHGDVQTWARIGNVSREHTLLDLDDDWLSAIKFHAGKLQQQPGARRYIVERHPDATLFVDMMPRTKREVLDAASSDGDDIAALLIALGGLSLIVLTYRRRGGPWIAIGLIVAVRIALLRVSVDSDPLHIFGFDVFGSKILGPFSRSPVDLILTAGAVLAIVAIATRLFSRWTPIVHAFVSMIAAAGFVELARNLVANSRISSMPDHIAPSSTAQALLLGAMVLFAFTLLQVTRHYGTLRHTIVALAIVAVPAIAAAMTLGPISGIAFLYVAAAVAASLLLHALTAKVSLRMLGCALLTAIIVWAPVQRFERESARRFVASTYAPFVIGESGQLRGMIEDTLGNEFSNAELSAILPDDYTRMNLDDLAWALWLQSDLSRWRIPAVITINDAEGKPISRFGVGLPQFSERNSQVGREILQVGSLTRVLIHHDFTVTAYGRPIARGSVHVVNPADPGATSFADAYRDFFEAANEDVTTGLHAQREPVVYDANGSAHGNGIRLPQSPMWYFAHLKPGAGTWAEERNGTAIYVRRADNALYAFPVDVPTAGEQFRRAGGVAIWAIALTLIAMTIRAMPLIVDRLRTPRAFDFRTRTSVYLTLVVIVPLLVFVLFVRAYLASRLEADYVDRGQTALTAAQRVIEDYVASTTSTRPEQILDDEILSWLARVVGHDLHVYKNEQLFASSRRDLFAAHVESERLPGDVYSAIILAGRPVFRATRTSGSTQYVEIYSPISLARDANYTLALPFIVQARQIRAEVNDLATTIYMLLVFIVLAAIAVAFRTARTMTTPVQALVGGARAVAAGNFDYPLQVPPDPDLGLLVTTFRAMAQSIRKQQNELRHERDRLQTLLENINAAVVVRDASGHVAATNLTARKLFGEDVRFPPEVRQMIREHQRRRFESRELDLNVDESLRTFRVSIVPLPESDEEMVIAEDVTEILRSNRLEAWGEMARQVAHEIKNPLTPIQLTAEHLRAVAERDDASLPAVVRSAVDNILRQVVVLRETSKEFSDYASLRQVQRKPLDLRGLLANLAKDYGSSRRFTAAIEPSTPSHYSGDERMLRGAIANLIENALQAAPNGTVHLDSRAVDSKVIVSIEDSGPGVPPELLPKIFDPYFSTKSSGTGLGLAIARKAIEEHGGTVHAENLNPGFRIAIELPMRS